jgi:hypothetical protein
VTATTTEPVADPAPTRLFDPAWRTWTIGCVALITMLAFEALAVTAAMPAVARALDGLQAYALASAPRWRPRCSAWPTPVRVATARVLTARCATACSASDWAWPWPGWRGT